MVTTHDDTRRQCHVDNTDECHIDNTQRESHVTVVTTITGHGDDTQRECHVTAITGHGDNTTDNVVHDDYDGRRGWGKDDATHIVFGMFFF
jgi:hypothetical protein